MRSGIGPTVRPAFGPAQFLSPLANFAWRSPWLSPLVLPLAILGVVGSCYRRIGIGLTVYALFVLAIWWLFTHRIDRFWIPIFPVLAFLAGLAVSPGAMIGWRSPLKLVLAAGLVVNLILIVAGSAATLRTSSASTASLDGFLAFTSAIGI